RELEAVSWLAISTMLRLRWAVNPGETCDKNIPAVNTGTSRGGTGKTDSMCGRARLLAITQHGWSRSGGSARLHQCHRTPFCLGAHDFRQDVSELLAVPPRPVQEALSDRVPEAPLCTRPAMGYQSSIPSANNLLCAAGEKNCNKSQRVAVSKKETTNPGNLARRKICPARSRS